MYIKVLLLKLLLTFADPQNVQMDLYTSCIVDTSLLLHTELRVDVKGLGMDE